MLTDVIKKMFGSKVLRGGMVIAITGKTLSVVG
jgi:hypothetical protein